MEKLSGLVLDHYDDARGEVLKGIFPTLADVPAFIKNAHRVTDVDREALPDDAFALVMKSGDVVLRKYACIDAGNTALAVEYFLREGHKLPAEAQKTAAANLLVACDWYDLPKNTILEKVAFGALLAGLGRAAVGAAGRLGGALKANPIGTAMDLFGKYQTAQSVVDTAKDVAGRLKQVKSTGMLPTGQQALST